MNTLSPLAFFAGRSEFFRPSDVASVTATVSTVHAVLEFVLDCELVVAGRKTVSSNVYVIVSIISATRWTRGNLYQRVALFLDKYPRRLEPIVIRLENELEVFLICATSCAEVSFVLVKSLVGLPISTGIGLGSKTTQRG